MKNLGFVTSEEDPLLIQDDRLCIPFLEQLGFSAQPLVWDRDGDKFLSYDALIFRSCWNYHRKYELFLNWMNLVSNSSVPTFNSIEVSKWNLNKRYLLELGAKGAPIPKTELFSRAGSLRKIIEKMGVDQIVIKPVVSLNGEDTYLCPAGELSKIEEVLNRMPTDHEILIQEFIPEIKTSGEVSLIFFNRKFSHAIRKTAAANEFRIHAEHGGSRAAFSPSAELIAKAHAILQLIKGPLLFSRVDMVERASGPVLIELEIADPMLFLGMSLGAPLRFAQVIADAVSAKKGTVT